MKVAKALLLVSVVWGVGSARAQVGSDAPASIVVFPKIIVDGTRDTVVQLSNTSNFTAYAHCWYLDGALPFPLLPPGPDNQPQWTSTDFALALTHQQPTNWVVSQGRPADATEAPCSRLSDNDCYGAGIDPGPIPVIAQGFTGELRCIETDAIGAPLSGNHLTGEATLEDLASGDVAKYSAIGIAGRDGNDGDGVLRLGEEYAACPDALRLDHAAEGVAVAAAGEGSSVDTELTIVPCTANLVTQAPESVLVQVLVTNEFEQRFSASQLVNCWRNVRLLDIGPVFGFDHLGTPTAQTRLRSSAASASGILAVAEERWRVGDLAARAAFNVHSEGVRAAGDLITVP